MISKSAIFFWLFCATSSFAHAQGEANMWHFGRQAGLDFNFTPPKVITTSVINALEGCASISDPKGRLLFYTDGLTVWDKRDTVMTNGTGLNGHNSSTQSAVIVPDPGSSNKYYIFTVDGATGRRKGGYYNIVDMSKNGGLGEVVAKNQALFTQNYTFESIGATPHANGRSYWVCYVDTNSTILSYLVSSTGVNTTPVRSQLKNGSLTNRMSHYMKFSSDNTMMAVAIDGLGLVLSQFDPSTGKFSNSFTVKSGSSWTFYGIEFSPESKCLYSSDGFQYDVSTFDSSLIINSAYQFVSSSTRAALQLGPDGKIYFKSRRSGSKMSFIEHPDKTDSACTVILDSIDLLGGTALLGLPTFLQSLLNPNLVSKGICYGEPSPFHVTDSFKLDSAVWNFGDTASGAANHATSFSPKHTFSRPGQYEVTTVVYRGGISADTLSVIVNIKDYLGSYRMIGEDLFKCRDDSVSIQLANDSNFLKQEWNTNDTLPRIATSAAGQYWVKAYEGKGCFFTDTMSVFNYVNNEKPGVLSLIDTIVKCPKKVVTIGTKDTFPRYRWNSGDTTGELSTDDKGRYILTVYHDSSCISLDTTDILYYPVSEPNLGPDTTYCDDQKKRVGDRNQSFAKYNWNTGSTDPFIFTDTSGTYIMTVETNDGCLMADTVEYTFVTAAPDLVFPEDTVFCDSIGPNAFLTPVNKGGVGKYRWQDGESDTAIFIDKKGIYVVSASNACGQDVDSFNVRVVRSPQIDLTPRDTFCDSVRVVLKPDTSGDGLRYLWSTSDTTYFLKIDTPGVYLVQSENECGTDSASTEIIKLNSPFAEPILDSILCVPISYSQKLSHNDPDASFRWLDPVRQSILSINDSVEIFNAGLYILEIDNFCGNHSDTFELTGYTVPVVDLGPDGVVCDTLSKIMNAGKSQNGESYLWSTGSTASNLQVSDPGTYWAYAVNKCGEDSDTIQLSLYFSTEVELPADTVVCDANELELDVSIPGANNEYLWDHGPNSALITVTDDGMYTVRVRNLCTDQQRSIDVTFLETPVKGLQEEYLFCDVMQNTELSAGKLDNDEVYEWHTGAQSRSITATAPGTYTVQISNACGDVEDTSRIILSVSPFVDLGPDTPVCGDIQYVLDAGNPGSQYNWNTGEVSESITATEQAIYAVTVTNAKGCSSFGQMEITDDCRTTIYLPDVFSPNGDGLNDLFIPLHLANVSDFTLDIYNRWGQKVFSTTDPTEGWDGSYLGIEALTGAYLVSYRYRNLEKRYFEGSSKVIYLVR